MPRKRKRDAQPDDATVIAQTTPPLAPASPPPASRGAYDALFLSGGVDDMATMRVAARPDGSGEPAQFIQSMQDAQDVQDSPYTIPPTGSPTSAPTGATTRARRTLGDTIHHAPLPSQPMAGTGGAPAPHSTHAPAHAPTPTPTRPPNPTMPPASKPHATRSRRPTRPTLPPDRSQRAAFHYDEAGLAGLDIFTTDERRAVMGGDNLPSPLPADASPFLVERAAMQVEPYGDPNAPGADASQAGNQALAVVSDAESRALATRPDDATAPLLIRGASKAPAPYRPIVPARRSGRASFITQFVIAMISAVVIFTTLTLASPLGRMTGISSSFQAYANAVPIPPTPTPTPKPKPQFSPPTGVNPGQQTIINDIIAVFGGYSSGALAVAKCESGYDPNARNPYAIGNSHAEGVFQILYPSTWDTTSYSGYSPYNYDANIHAAHQIFARDGDTWREWQCQP